LMLRDSEDKFSKSFFAAPISMAISTIEDGRLLEVNEAFERLSGYTSDEVIGQTAMEIGIWHDPQERHEMITLLEEEGEVRELEITLRDRGCRLRSCLYSALTIYLHGEKLLLSLWNDITERKQAEEALRKAHGELELRVAKRTEELAKSTKILKKEIRERKRIEETLKAEADGRMQAMDKLLSKEQMLLQQSSQAAMGKMIGNIAHQWRQPLNTLGLIIQQLKLLYSTFAVAGFGIT